MCQGRFLTLLKSKYLLEIRTKDTLVLLCALSLMLSVVISLGLGASFLDTSSTQKLFPGFVWLVFFFSSSLAIGRSYEYEVEEQAFEGILLTGVPQHLVFLSKQIIIFLSLCVSHFFSLCVLSFLLQVPLHNFGYWLLISLLVILAYSFLATLLSGIAIHTRLRQIILPLLLIPLSTPLFAAAIELSSGFCQTGILDFSSPWFSLLLLLNLVYGLLGINLFETVVKG